MDVDRILELIAEAKYHFEHGAFGPLVQSEFFARVDEELEDVEEPPEEDEEEDEEPVKAAKSPPPASKAPPAAKPQPKGVAK